MTKKIIVFTLFCFLLSTISAQSYVIRGHVVDQQTGESLSGAAVFEMKSNGGTSTNSYGLYTVNLPKGKCILRCSVLGYIIQTDTLNLTNDTIVNFALKQNNYMLQDVVILGTKHSGQLQLNQQTIQTLPVVGGEPDLMKSLQYLPGVTSGNEGTNNISIRGSNQWGNLVLLDEAIVFNPNHALSFFSVFNNDAIQNVNLYKSYFPLNYGGKASAVIDVRMKDGNNNEHNRTATIGLIASKIFLEGPFEKNKSSYMVAARIAYPGAVCSLLGNGLAPNVDMYFYDINAKINKVINDRNRIYFSIYNGGDHTVFDRLVKGYGMNWGNTTSTLRWNSILNAKTFSTTSAIFSNYYYRYKTYDGLRYLWKSNMQSYQLKYHLEHTLSQNIRLKGGGAIHLFTTVPGKLSNYDNYTHIVPYRMERKTILDYSLYGEMELTLNKFQLNGGLRMSLFKAPAKNDINSETFVIPEPRIELLYKLNREQRLNLSFNQASQTVHMLSNSSVGIPSDMWIPANKELKPVVMRQFTAGYGYAVKNISFSVEAFFRKSNHIIDFKNNANLFLNNCIEDDIAQGKSTSYGLEFYISKNQGNLSGWTSYTLSRARNKIDNIQKTTYKPVYDRPHNLKVYLNYKVNKKWSLSTTFSYCSGMNITVPIGKYDIQGVALYIYTSKNSYRAPAFHQLDLSTSYQTKKGTLSFSVINIYNRKNVFSIYAGRGVENYLGMTHARMYKMYLFGTIPSLTYSFKF